MSLLLIGGSLRGGSGNAAVLRTVHQLSPESVIYGGLGRLPHFNPDDDREPLDSAVAELRAGIKAAHALLFCTPEYAGGLPGSFKNLLDWTVGGGEIYAKPVAWINASSVAAPTGGADAHESLRKVLGYAGAVIVDEACARIPIPRDAVSDGVVQDPDLRRQITDAVTKLVSGAAAGL
jgi:NAD(P)H-dependent FMN reductase